jgi:hypothetical protein
MMIMIIGLSTGPLVVVGLLPEALFRDIRQPVQ